jgi:hypothetical protein
VTVSNGDILKVVIEFNLPNGTIGQNVYYFRAQLAAAQADQTVLNNLETWVEALYANLEPQIVSSVTFNDMVVDVVAWDGTKWETTYHVGTEDLDITPTSAAEALPNQVSPFATFNTERPKSKGRKFCAGFGETSTVGSILAAGALADMVAFATDALDNIVIGLFNDLIPGIVRKGVNEFLDYLSATVTNVVGTQRRRRPGVGI